MLPEIKNKRYEFPLGVTLDISESKNASMQSITNKTYYDIKLLSIKYK